MKTTRRQLDNSLKTTIIALKNQNMSLMQISESLFVPKSTMRDFLNHLTKKIQSIIINELVDRKK